MGVIGAAAITGFTRTELLDVGNNDGGGGGDKMLPPAAVELSARRQ